MTTLADEPEGAAIAAAVLEGDRRAIARAISLVEAGGARAAELITQIHHHTGRAYLVGVTGSPGVGKSSLVDRLTGELRGRGHTVGVLAVDPSSPFSGGAVLGDRVRMRKHAGDAGVFVRSMATRGELGGLARATGDAAVVLDAAGYTMILIETVGVGQAEVEISRAADVTMVVTMPGAGDGVQAMKAGVMEIADLFVVNKADLDGVDRAVTEINAMLGLNQYTPDDWRPGVLETTATDGMGVAAVVDTVERFRAQGGDLPARRRRGRVEVQVRGLVSRRFLEHAERVLEPGAVDRLIDRVAAAVVDPYTAADEIVKKTIGREG